MLDKAFSLTSLAPGRFETEPAVDGGLRVYGGLTLAQALNSAFSTVGPNWLCHTLHAQFLRPVRPDLGVTLEVESPSDGRSFAVRRIVVQQDGKVVLTATASLQVAQTGLDYQAAAPDEPAGPEAFPSERDRYHPVYLELCAQGVQAQELPRGVDARLTVPQAFHDPRVLPARHRFWVRTPQSIPDGAQAQQVALAFCSDMNMNEPSLRPHGLSWMRPQDVAVATLDHSIWFHRPADAVGWMIHDVECVSTSGGRGTMMGRIFDRAGRLIASTAQESLLRCPSAEARDG